MKTVVINMFAGSGAGKTTCAWEVASELKKRGFITEYVAEYAKELVWEKNFTMLDGTLQHQRQLLTEQAHRLERLVSQVDFIVTDSPLFLNALYYTKGTPERKKAYTDEVYRAFSSYENFSVFIKRGKGFEKAGHIHDLEQSKKIDQNIKNLLQEYHVFYGIYTYETAHLVVDNCIRTYRRVNLIERGSYVQEEPEDREPTENLGKKAEEITEKRDEMSLKLRRILNPEEGY